MRLALQGVLQQRQQTSQVLLLPSSGHTRSPYRLQRILSEHYLKVRVPDTVQGGGLLLSLKGCLASSTQKIIGAPVSSYLTGSCLANL